MRRDDENEWGIAWLLSLKEYEPPRMGGGIRAEINVVYRFDNSDKEDAIISSILETIGQWCWPTMNAHWRPWMGGLDWPNSEA